MAGCGRRIGHGHELGHGHKLGFRHEKELVLKCTHYLRTLSWYIQKVLNAKE